MDQRREMGANTTPSSHPPVSVVSVLEASTHYEVLGLLPHGGGKKGVSPATRYAAAYKKAVVRVHPDKSDHPRAEEAFQLLQEAYKVLSDHKLRAVYNDELKGRSKKGEALRTKEAHEQRARAEAHAEARAAELVMANSKSRPMADPDKVRREAEERRERDVANRSKLEKVGAGASKTERNQAGAREFSTKW